MPRLRKSLGVMPNSRLPRRQKCALLLNPSDRPAQRWRSPRHRHLPQPIGRIVRRIVPCHLGIPGLHYGVASHWESSDLGASIDAGSPGLIANLAHLVLCAHRDAEWRPPLTLPSCHSRVADRRLPGGRSWQHPAPCSNVSGELTRANNVPQDNLDDGLSRSNGASFSMNQTPCSSAAVPARAPSGPMKRHAGKTGSPRFSIKRLAQAKMAAAWTRSSTSSGVRPAARTACS